VITCSKALLEKELKMSKVKFANAVAKVTGIKPAVGMQSESRARRFGHAYVGSEVDGSFEIANMPQWAQTRLLEAGFTASGKVRARRWATDEPAVVLYWSAA
jgi:hypothetical protein